MVDNSGLIGGGVNSEYEFTYGESLNALDCFDLAPDGKIYKTSGNKEGLIKHIVGKSTGTANFQFNSYYIESLNVLAIVYRDDANSDYPTLVLGQINSDFSITWCDTAIVIESSACEAAAVTYDENLDRLVVLYSIGTAIKTIVGTITGSGASLTCSFGTAVATATGGSSYTAIYFDEGLRCVYDPNTQRIVTAYGKGTNNHDFYARVGQVSTSPDSITFGTEQVIQAGVFDEKTIDMIYDTVSSKVIVTYELSSSIRAKAGTVTGGATNSISFGAAATAFNDIQNGQPARVLSDTVNSKLVVMANRYTTSTGGANYVGMIYNSATVSGSTITFGTANKRVDENLLRPAWNGRAGGFRAYINNDTGEILAVDQVEGSANRSLHLIDNSGNIIAYDNIPLSIEVSYALSQFHYLGRGMFLLLAHYPFMETTSSSGNTTVGFWKIIRAGNGSLNSNPRPVGITKESGVLNDVKKCSLSSELVGVLDKAVHSGLTPGVNYYTGENGTLSPNSRSWKDNTPYSIETGSTSLGGGQIRTRWNTEAYYGFALSATQIIKNGKEVGRL